MTIRPQPEALLITGAEARPNAAALPEGSRYVRGQMLRLNLTTGATELLLTREALPDAYPEELPSVIFGAADRSDGELFLCTNTEILVYRYPDLKLVRQASFPFFNEVHSVVVDGSHLLVSSTGMDLAVVLDRQTLLPLQIRHALGLDPKVRYDWDSHDYRRIRSLKPHDSHPNFVFRMENQIWVTRFNQRDAVSLDDSERRIDIAVERPHDGHVHGDRVHFTTVNGHVVSADTKSRKVVRDVDLNEIETVPGPLGWCRGMLVVGDIFYVGFSQLRSTALKENVRWVRNRLRGVPPRPTRVVAYDLAMRRILREYPLPEKKLSALFGILPA